MNAAQALSTIQSTISGWFKIWNEDRKAKKGWSTSQKIELLTATSNPGGQPRSRGSTKLQVVFKEPQYYTVQFSLIPLGVWPVDVLRRARATVTWSVAGNSSVRRVLQIVDGTGISGTGEGVEVSIEDDSHLFFPVTVNCSYLVSAQVTPGTRPSYANSQPPILLPTENNGLAVTIAAAGRESWDVPDQSGANAVWIYINPTTVTLDLIEVSFLGTGGPTNEIVVTTAELVVGQWMPLPTGTDVIQIDNNGGANIEVLPVFGIEG